MKPSKLAQLISLLFYSRQPLKKADLQKSLGLSETDLSKLADQARSKLEPLGLTLTSTEAELQLVTNGEVAETISNYFEKPKTQLSQANLEVLAVVAYKQPITRAEIDQVRGIASDQTIKNLINLDLIKKDHQINQGVSKAVYRTTATFLSTIGIKSLKELPKANVNFENPPQ